MQVILDIPDTKFKAGDIVVCTNPGNAMLFYIHILSVFASGTWELKDGVVKTICDGPQQEGLIDTVSRPALLGVKYSFSYQGDSWTDCDHIPYTPQVMEPGPVRIRPGVVGVCYAGEIDFKGKLAGPTPYFKVIEADSLENFVERKGKVNYLSKDDVVEPRETLMDDLADEKTRAENWGVPKDWPHYLKRAVLNHFKEIDIDNYDYADNFRFARTNDAEEVKAYEKARLSSCCGEYDEFVMVEHENILIGFNHGH